MQTSLRCRCRKRLRLYQRKYDALRKNVTRDVDQKKLIVTYCFSAMTTTWGLWH